MLGVLDVTHQGRGRKVPLRDTRDTKVLTTCDTKICIWRREQGQQPVGAARPHYGVVIVTPSVRRREIRPPSGMHAPIPRPLWFGPAVNSVCAVAFPLIFTVLPPTSSDTPLAAMNVGAFFGTTLRITCVPLGSVTPLLPCTGTVVVAVNLSPLLLLVLHTRDPDASSSVVPGPMDPVFATGAGGGAGAGAGAGEGRAVAGADAGAEAGAEAGAVDDGLVPLLRGGCTVSRG
jgi:hypothetical protein